MTRSGFLDIDGAEIYYEIDGAGPPVVLLHAAAMNLRMWDPQVATLAKRLQVVRFDQRGHGRSSLPPTPYWSHEDIRRVLKALGLAQPHLVGSSMGARVAVDYAISYPESLRSLVLVSGAISGYQLQDRVFLQNVDAISKAVERDDLATAVSLVLPLMVAETADPAIRKQVRAIIEDYSWESWRGTDWSLDPERAALDHLDEIQAPTLVVVGQLDGPDSHRQATILAKGVRNGRLVEVQNAGHMLNMERADAFNRVLSEFLERAAAELDSSGLSAS